MRYVHFVLVPLFLLLTASAQAQEDASKIVVCVHPMAAITLIESARIRTTVPEHLSRECERIERDQLAPTAVRVVDEYEAKHMGVLLLELIFRGEDTPFGGVRQVRLFTPVILFRRVDVTALAERVAL